MSITFEVPVAETLDLTLIHAEDLHWLNDKVIELWDTEGDDLEGPTALNLVLRIARLDVPSSVELFDRETTVSRQFGPAPSGAYYKYGFKLGED